ncbi:GAF domain-containing protein [Arthrobacter sp. ISL-72]|uniref:GAF domain-containing protein n=1 Tax=Arthrobacter sp. ISL-72 TaxID=2819114 RepID=UPI001BEAD50C|nr:GAF domain-containing protein [Arthrobacter sp. ISL-72]MBT2595922.1 GAF domain-containing protein [Arthrobacter sp. ISL-72]
MNSRPEAGGIFPVAILDSPDVQAFLIDAVQEFLGETGGQARGFLWAITQVGSGELRNWASGSSKACEIDGVQRQFADGPARAAVAGGEFIHIPDAAVDRRWPGFSAAVASQGIGSVLSVPMTVEEASAAFSLYGACPHAFTSADVVAAIAFTRRLTKVCQLLLELGRKAGAGTGQTLLSVIELAVWTLIREFGLTNESAMRYLQAVVHDMASRFPAVPTAGTGTALPAAEEHGRKDSLLDSTDDYP